MATEQEILMQWREYFDTAMRNVGIRAPAPVLGQSTHDYIRETCRTLKRQCLPQSHEYYQVNYRGLRADALKAIVPSLLKACAEEAVDPKNLAPGEIRMVVRKDINGVEHRDWIGQQSFVRDMMRPGRRVVSFTTDRGRYDAAKARWF